MPGMGCIPKIVLVLQIFLSRERHKIHVNFVYFLSKYYIMKTLTILLFSFCFYFSPVCQVTEADSLALVAFYHATGGPEWTMQGNWLTNTPVGEWYGINIDNERVTGIDLYENNLTGSLPPELGVLSGLTRIYLPSNFLSGEIPPEIGQCTSLITLDLYVNNITGTFPDEITACQQLSSIVIYKNEMSGTFPIALLGLPNLWRLELGTNNFTGELPSELNDLVNLRLLNLSRNNFSGQMISLKNLTSMTELHLGQNDLHGDFADIFSYCPNMYYLTLGLNHFTGCLSDTFFNPEKLQFFDFPQNDFDCVGDFSSFSDTGVLKRLNLYGNRIPFEYLEPNVGVNNYTYAPQQALLARDTMTLMLGDSIEIQSGSMGQHTHYSWYKDGMVINGETNASLWVKGFDATKTGIYHCSMTNDSLPLLTLERNPVTLNLEGPSSVRELKSTEMNIFPNPVTNDIQIPSAYAHATGYIYDLMGRIVLNNLSVENGKINVFSIPEGFYILLLQIEDEVISGRFLKSNSR